MQIDWTLGENDPSSPLFIRSVVPGTLPPNTAVTAVAVDFDAIIIPPYADPDGLNLPSNPLRWWTKVRT